MDYVQLLAIPLCLAASISAVTLICLYCFRFKVEPSSGEEKYVHRKKHHNKQIPDVSVVDCSSAPVHPYLPPSLCTVTSTPCGTDQLSVTRAGMDSSASGTVALLVRQEGNSHRNCELPPVPSGADYKQDLTELRRYSICDDPQSESDGLYASVGHHSTANGGVGISRSRHRPHATTTMDSNEAMLPTDHRDSVVDSVTAPYYSSVASVLLPNEYGDLSDCAVLRPYLPFSAQRLQSNNLYARVRPRHERLGLNIDANLQTTGTIPFDNLVEANGSRPNGLDSSVTVVDTSTHSPPRSTAESAYTSHGLHTSQTCFVARPFQSLFAAGDLTLTNENHYGKISVRESLASLRARRAFPQLGPNAPDSCRANCGQVSPNVTFGVQSEYERVSGSASETNNSTYDFVPQASTSVGPVAEIVQSIEPHSEPERKPRLSSDAYMDVSDSTGNERFTSDKSFVLVDSRPGMLTSTRTHILTEMQSFRHMDSEIDLTHSRQLDSDNGDMLITVRPRLIQSSEAFELGTHSNPGASRNSTERSILSHVDLHANRPRGPVLSSRSGAAIPVFSVPIQPRFNSLHCEYPFDH
ncbi:hypothetical protein EG68_02322 [Paragonimus skrjabini miyazakii]|uniref:Uncharacterized protein n=1 Tax=Paragonimus skrjabini miyazakii TaxID=59628 RepID=A0A8S9Z4H2_9TREM|nr:hypothetical protein EG68_02322 [Paragonimus skrjabini miyazakii]